MALFIYMLTYSDACEQRICAIKHTLQPGSVTLVEEVP